MKKHALFASVLLSAAMLAGCDMSTPSQIAVKQIEIRRTVKTETVNALRADPSRAQALADSYAVNNSGPVAITMSYVKGSRKDAAAVKKGGNAWAALLRKGGVASVTVDAVAVDDPAYADQAVIAWPAKIAAAPKDCGRLPGYQGAEPIEVARKYTMGCETQSALAKQVAVNPDDLMGRAGLPEDDSRRQGAMTDKYLSGKPNAKLNGVSASGTSGGSSGGG